MTIIINPGTGPVNEATLAVAWSNIAAFINDLAESGIEVTTVQRVVTDDDDGRFNFRLHTADDLDLDIDMPGVESARLCEPDDEEEDS